MRIFFFGNCQIKALHDVYTNFVLPLTGDTLAWSHSATPLTPEHAAFIASADVVVVQAAHFEPKTDITGIETKARRMVVPVVGTPFLWPYSGMGHPDSMRKYGKYNPFPPEQSDSWLVRRLQKGAAPAQAVAEYLALDVAKTSHVERRMEMELDLQRTREAGTPYAATDIIAANFRTEKLFRTPYHLCLRMARYMALTFLADLGVPDAAYQRVAQRMLDDLYIKTEVPVHPSVAAHFGLAWVNEDTRYRFYAETLLTRDQFYDRLVHCQAYPEVPEAWLAVSRQEPQARAKLQHALTLIPESPFLLMAMGKLLLAEGKPGEALDWMLRAQAGYPELHGVHGQLADILWALGRHDEAIAQLRLEIARNPYILRLYIALTHWLEKRGAWAEAAKTLEAAITLEPTRGDFVPWRTQMLQRAQQDATTAS